ncbi:MAG: TIGR04283 family arsenosugar biosynthesis glycosyltransferase [Candidatus Hydrogenedentota bacterium]
MRNNARVSVIIPAINEAQSIAHVLDDIPDWVDEVIVADNGSTDDTVSIAESHGARVVHENQHGYGAACLRGIHSLSQTDIVVFLDGDYSDHPEQMDTLVDPIINNTLDIVIGSRALGKRERGALTPQARFGNILACFLMRLFWGVRYTDLGPFRAIRYSSLQNLGMADTNYGWTVEMQIKATLQQLRSGEVPVDYRKRIGRSKVSGTVRGVIGAGYKILSTLFISAIKYHLFQKKRLATRKRLIIFTRYPEPGKTKTRLIPTLGALGAADLQRAMTEHALATAQSLVDIDIEINYTGADEAEMKEWLGKSLHYREQHGDDLGDRMRYAFSATFNDSIDAAIIIGIDCPAITPTLLNTAFDALHTHALTLGPATDGGYYLIGLQRDALSPLKEFLFKNIPWGTEEVYPTTVSRLDDQNASWKRLVYLNDIDEAEDLPEWHRHQPDATIPSLSVVIPVLNEANTIESTLERLGSNPDIQIILADGGSTDATRSIAESRGALVITTPRGRAIQMNIGAAHAAADTVFFLHGDTIPPDTYQQEIKATLSRLNAAAGAFHFNTSDESLPMRIIRHFTNLRARLLQLPYGDQGLFLSKTTFHAVSGYEDLPIMEDFVIVRTLKKHGQIRLAPSKTTTCARRWQRQGPWRTTLYNLLTIFAWHIGISPHWLAERYRRSSHTSPTGSNPPD